MNRRQALRTKEPLKMTNTPPITTAPTAEWEKKLEIVTKQLAAFTSWRNPPPHLMSGTGSAPTRAPYRDSAFKCYYCFQKITISTDAAFSIIQKFLGTPADPSKKLWIITPGRPI
ncbi:uncharacterized protein VP01_3938g2 [Puccinia sorghi]|uniref:Uncharacterized protein n=1 Tax=Puccinia sorghi TaxID=27349 RepID=A0A0L6USK0_9BASI|nr:uncharacterized protein VP01_3938g2 [Puccinia sorghi]